MYELRNRATGKLIYCGEGRNVAKRMTALLPQCEGGAGKRNNKRLREYVHERLADIDYRTKACADKASAKIEERKHKAENGIYVFPT